MQAYPNEGQINFLAILLKRRTFANNIIDGVIEKKNRYNFKHGSKFFLAFPWEDVLCDKVSMPFFFGGGVLLFMHFGSKEPKRWAPLKNKI